MSTLAVHLPHQPTRQQVLRRRRLVALVFLAAFALALLVGASQVLANRGGAPASTPTVRPATEYVVQPGDTMWSLAERFHGPFGRASYLDRLLDANNGPALQVGQVVTLP
jgi:LysM domain-containing protein